VTAQRFKCVDCGKPFVAAQAIGIIFGLASVSLFLAAFYTAYSYIVTDSTHFLFGDFETTFFIALFGAIMIALMRVGIRANLVAKHGSSPTTMTCSACRQKAADFAKYTAYNQQQAADARALDWAMNVESIERSDHWMGKLISLWRTANPGKVPSEALVDDLTTARNMEKAGNYEASAVILEKYHFWDEAGRVRKLDDEKIIKHITVDMNQLIEQLSTKGLAIPYKCHSCGASITIDKDSKKEGLKFCSYCGTTYNVEDMTKIIQTALD
jgi:DNA-directed RNA polymerase subunit RPC12/RpoP